MTSLRVICGLGPLIKNPGYAYATDTITFSPLVIAFHANNLQNNVLNNCSYCKRWIFNLCFFHKNSVWFSLPLVPAFRLQLPFFLLL